MRSRAVRNAVVAGGLRTIAAGGLPAEEQQQEGGLVSRFFNAAGRFAGFLVKNIFQGVGGLIQWSWTALWGGIVSASMFLYNFNWNISDAALDQQIQGQWNQLAGSLGGTLGNAMGWLACGVLPGTVMFSFNEALGLYVLKNVGEEALEELAGNIANLSRLTFAAAGKTAFAYLFKKARRAIRGEVPEDAKPWSFANQVEERVESIDNQAFQNFVEEFLEEASDACIEAGYVVANTLDSFMAAQKLANQGLLGEQQIIEVEFERGLEPPQQT
jgi:hypothetical protein